MNSIMCLLLLLRSFEARTWWQRCIIHVAVMLCALTCYCHLLGFYLIAHCALFIFYTLNIVDVDYVCNSQNWTGVQWPYYSNASIFLSNISFRFGLKKTELIWKMLNSLSFFLMCLEIIM